MLNRFVLVFVIFFVIPVCVFAQQKDSLAITADSLQIKDSTKLVDSLITDSTKKITDSSVSIKPVHIATDSALNKILGKNIFLNSKGKPQAFIQSTRKPVSKDEVFFALAFIVLLFAILKVLYPRYFSNLFRVFFNTSLRQSQLTDQLLQAKLPSLFYNIFFILIGGWYLYLLLNFFGKTGNELNWQVLLTCAGGLITIYLAKFAILKFTGWITGFKQEADTYIFITFLINKIVAICLVPLIIIMAFSDRQLVDIAIVVSFIIIVLMVLMRFIRSYSLLQNRLKISRFHFFIYIVGIEIIPLLVIYKLALIFVSKNL